MKTYAAILTLFCMVIWGVPPRAEGSLKKVGTSGFTFLEMPVSARQEAMGEAVTALTNMGSDAVFGNPALLSAVSRYAVGVSYASYIADITHQGMSLAYNLDRWGTFGIGFVRLSMDDMQGTVVDNTAATGYRLTRKFSNGSYALGGTFASQMTDRFAFGLTVKYVHEGADQVETADGKVQNFKATNVIGDLGTIYYTGLGSLRFATNIQSFGVETKYVGDIFKMPIMFRIGAAMDFSTPDQNHLVTLSVEALHPSDYAERVVVGAEYWLYNIAALRAGYRFNTDQKKLSLGGGLKYNVGGNTVTLDAAYTDFSNLGDIFRFSLGYGF